MSPTVLGRQVGLTASACARTVIFGIKLFYSVSQRSPAPELDSLMDLGSGYHLDCCFLPVLELSYTFFFDPQQFPRFRCLSQHYPSCKPHCLKRHYPIPWYIYRPRHLSPITKSNPSLLLLFSNIWGSLRASLDPKSQLQPRQFTIDQYMRFKRSHEVMD